MLPHHSSFSLKGKPTFSHTDYIPQNFPGSPTQVLFKPWQVLPHVAQLPSPSPLTWAAGEDNSGLNGLHPLKGVGGLQPFSGRHRYHPGFPWTFSPDFVGTTEAAPTKSRLGYTLLLCFGICAPSYNVRANSSTSKQVCSLPNKPIPPVCPQDLAESTL